MVIQNIMPPAAATQLAHTSEAGPSRPRPAFRRELAQAPSSPLKAENEAEDIIGKLEEWMLIGVGDSGKREKIRTIFVLIEEHDIQFHQLKSRDVLQDLITAGGSIGIVRQLGEELSRFGAAYKRIREANQGIAALKIAPDRRRGVEGYSSDKWGKERKDENDDDDQFFADPKVLRL